MSNVASPDSIGSWSVTTLTKFIQDAFTRNPPRFFPVIETDELHVNDLLTAEDRAFFPLKQHVVGKIGDPVFEHSWVNFASGWQVATYYKDVFGFVRLSGVIKSGTVGSSAFTLPPGYRPAAAEPFSIVSNGVFGRVDVNGDGTVVPQSPSSNVSVSLSGIVFKAA